MKKYYLSLLMLTLIVVGISTSCKKEKPIKEGSIVFWTNFDAGSNIHIYQGNNNGYVTLKYTGTPDCNANGCFTTEPMPYGKYQFTAYNDLYSWTGEVSVTSSCTSYCLFR